jgi:hypothetical protein
MFPGPEYRLVVLFVTADGLAVGEIGAVGAGATLDVDAAPSFSIGEGAHVLSPVSRTMGGRQLAILFILLRNDARVQGID